MLKVHMYQTCANSQQSQPLTYAATVASSLTKYPVTELAIDHELFATQNSNPTPDICSLSGRKTHFLLSTIHDSKSKNFTDQTDHLLVASTSIN